MHDGIFKDAFVYLLAAGILVPLFHRARIGAVVGFIAIGALIGPHGLGALAGEMPLLRLITIPSVERVAPFGEMGVIFLLFLLGLEFSAGRLWAMRREVFGAGLMQVLLCGLPLALGAYLLGFAAGLSLVVGFALALSSTAVVTQLLIAQHRALAPLGQLVIAILLFQDLMVVPILLGTELLRAQEGALLLAITALAKAAGAVGLILIAGRYVLAPLVAAAASTGARDLIMAVTLVVIAGTAGLTHAAGLSGALGAFLAGMLLSETAYRHQIEVDLDPFKGLLIGVFFVTVGMSVDLAAVLPRLHIVLAATLSVLIAKSAFTFLATRLMGVPRPAGAEAAVLLAQSGEFALVAIGLLAAQGSLAPVEAGTLVAVVGLSLAATPVLARLGRRLALRLEGEAHGHLAAPDAERPAGHVVIGGFGRVGRTIAETLEREGVPFVAVDSDPHRVASERAAGRTIYFGDAGRGEILARLGAGQARAVVVTLDAPQAAETMVRAVRHRWPDAVLIARAKDTAHARRLAALGVEQVIPEAVEASLQLAARLLEHLGLPEEVVAARIAQSRAEIMSRIEAGSEDREPPHGPHHGHEAGHEPGHEARGAAGHGHKGEAARHPAHPSHTPPQHPPAET